MLLAWCCLHLAAASQGECAPIRKLSAGEMIKFNANAEILGLSLSATMEEIKRAHRQLALKWHPDKQQEDPNRASVEFVRVQEAYDTLKELTDKVKPASCRTSDVVVGVESLYAESAAIKAITPEFYREHVASKGSVWLIQFYTAKYERCRAQVSVFEQAAG